MGTVTVATLAVVAVVFGASTTTKLAGRAGYARYRDGLAATTLIGARAVASVAALLVVAELLVAAGALAAIALLVARPAAGTSPALAAGAAALALTAVLTGAVAVVVRRSVTAPCACFGATSARPMGRPHLIRNGVLLVVCVLAVVSAAVGGPAGRAADLVAVLPGAVTAVLLIRAEDLSALFAPTVARPRAFTPADRAVSGAPEATR